VGSNKKIAPVPQGGDEPKGMHTPTRIMIEQVAAEGGGGSVRLRNLEDAANFPMLPYGHDNNDAGEK